MNSPDYLYEYRNIIWHETLPRGYHYGRILMNNENYEEEGRVELINFANAKLPVYLLYVLLNEALGDGWVEKLEKIHCSRNNIWKVTVCQSQPQKPGNTAIREYRLCSAEGENTVCSSVIFVDQERIDSFSVRIEDAAPLLERIMQDFPPAFSPRFKKYSISQTPHGHYPYNAEKVRFQELPPPLLRYQKRKDNIVIEKNDVLNDPLQPGKTSGIIETVEALKCMEVLMA